jgi:MFS family permease
MVNRTSNTRGPDIDTAIYRKTMTKIIPILMMGLFVSYLDRANLGVLGPPISKDLGLTATQFGLAAGLFYIGYLVFEIPSNMALVRFGARKWIARIMLTWGIVTIGMAFVQDASQLYIARILLGLAEAGFSPGVYLFLAYWCAPRLLTKTYTWLNLAVPIALCIASALTSSLLLLDGVLGFAGWRWAFFLEGLPAIAVAVFIFIKLPDRPATATWLDENEKTHLAETSTQSHASGGHEWKHLPAILRRPSAWLFALTYFCITIGFWAITYFLPTIVREQFKVGAVTAGFISSLPWLLSGAVSLIVARSITRTGERTWHLTGVLLVGAVGLAFGALSGNPYIALTGVSLGAAGFFGALSPFWTMPAQVFTGGIAAAGIAMINSVGNLSGLLGPYVLGRLKDATGSTSSGLLVMSGFFVLAAILAFVMSRWTDRQTGGLSSGGPAEAAVEIRGTTAT